ncbi:hypothetical protein AB6A40_002773 [Gnathostoma spinigerum]|uniref:Helicase SKI2W n=1 Tax=Gnathostoma spinigerum TaxID=75299 RepID=A0ABD6E7J2_9BILA
MDSYSSEITEEAEKVLKIKLLDALTQHPAYDISSTYDVPEPKEVDLNCLTRDVLALTAIDSIIIPDNLEDTEEYGQYTEVFVELDEFGDSKSSSSFSRRQDIRSSSGVIGSCSCEPFLPGGFDQELDELLSLHRSVDDELIEEEKDDDMKLAGPLGLKDIFTDSSDSAADVTKSEPNTYAVRDSGLDSQQKTIDFSSSNIFDLIDFLSGNECLPTPLNDNEKQQHVSDDSTKHESSGNEDATSTKNISKEDESTVSEPDRGSYCLSSQALPEYPLEQLIVEREPAEASEKSDLSESGQGEFVRRPHPDSITCYEAMKDGLAKKFPFELDVFQKQAIVSLEMGRSVFVAAHTSAGKTVVAEYAIALCRAHRTRVIYTSPIKALSNQKFRDFKTIFDDVGLITGDNQINEDAFALIMTTEVLRSMLYNGSEVIRELEWVIFDEVHYVNDAERGHVWEEVLIMLPSQVKIIMLSATVPNHFEFADWVGRIKNCEITVIMTAYRPVPLEHYLYAGQDGKTRDFLFRVVDSSGQFLSSQYRRVSMVKDELKKASSKKMSSSTRNLDKNIYINLISHLKQNDLLPVIVFVFSRKRCDENALLLRSVDLTTAKEKSDIHHFFNCCISRVKEVDRNLPQILFMADLCSRGFAVHHSGILPILKEIVEYLFQKGYVKLLFATETFSMGVNMPARTVVFDSMEKFDGNTKRYLKPSEYIQMAGRAGRRGIDVSGTVVLLCKGPSAPDSVGLFNMMMGKAEKLTSHFRITNSMLLNLLRVERVRIEDMLQRSFAESSSLKNISANKSRLRELNGKISKLPQLKCPVCNPAQPEFSLYDYYMKLEEFVELRSAVWSEACRSHYVSKFFTPGRLVIVSLPEVGLKTCLAVLLQAKNESGNFVMELFITIREDFAQSSGTHYSNRQFRCLSKEEQLRFAETSMIEISALHGLEHPVHESEISTNNMFYVVENVPVHFLVAICQKTFKIDPAAIRRTDGSRYKYNPKMPPDICDSEPAKLFFKLESEIEKWDSRTNDKDLLLLGRDIPISSVDLYEKVERLNNMRQLLMDGSTYKCKFCVNLYEHLGTVRNELQLKSERDKLIHLLSPAGLLFSKEYDTRIKVLHRLGYIDRDNLVTLKGRIACEIHHQELLVTELILENKLQGKSVPEIAALLSSAVCQSKAKDANDFGQVDVDVPETLFNLRDEVINISNKIYSVHRDCGLNMTNPEEEISFALMFVVYKWADAMVFSELMELTNVHEGIIVRCIQRLDELCKDIRNAARLIGDPEFYEKMSDVSSAIKRDIVFAASLYTVVD